MEIDNWGLSSAWQKGSGDWEGIQKAIVKGERIQVIQEVGSTEWINTLPDNHPFYFGFPDLGEYVDIKGRVWISCTQRQFCLGSAFPKVQWHPRVLWVGIGCSRGIAKELIEFSLRDVFRSHHLALGAIAGITTIDLKSDEVGLLAYCQEREIILKTFSAEVLSSVRVPNPREVVARYAQTPSVAEAAAILGAKGDLLVTKQVIKGDGGTVTLAIAISEQEYP
jgi:cobalt-precorrin 5A hydrolase/precorrin-3B C17-methyltransferase